jgi:hypothetical protein
VTAAKNIRDTPNADIYPPLADRIFYETVKLEI